MKKIVEHTQKHEAQVKNEHAHKHEAQITSERMHKHEAQVAKVPEIPSCCSGGNDCVHEEKHKHVGVEKNSIFSRTSNIPNIHIPEKVFVYVNSVTFWRALALVAFGLIVLSQLFSVRIEPKFKLAQKKSVTSPNTVKTTQPVTQITQADLSSLEASVFPKDGIQLPIQWGNLGKRMIADGVIDEQKFKALFENGMQNMEENILTGTWDKPIVISQENSRFMLDILWAFGLANKNDVLEKGEMSDPKYGGPGNFASTGGWSISKGKAMDHYSKHPYVTLTKEQQELVDRVSRGIFRPCCGNSTHFPDCNHGMAMLGLLELMAANGATEKEMYKIALVVNSYWFPQTYIDLAAYFKERGQDWSSIDPKVVLGIEYSSAQGYQKTRQNTKSLPQPKQSSGGCGV